MSYWSVVPTVVRKSKRLSAEEKELYYEISDRLNEGGYCTATNEELAKALSTSTKTITARLAGLKQKKFANIILNLHKHRRQIYLNVPGEPPIYDEPKPTDDTLKSKRQRLEESLKKAIVFGTIDFNTLIQKLKESPYLDEVEDNTTQFILSEEQLDFLAKFKRYKTKKIDCQMASFPSVDYKNLLRQIELSEFLSNMDNLSLKWILKNSADILAGKYRTFDSKKGLNKKDGNFTGRIYSSDDLNNLWSDIDEW